MLNLVTFPGNISENGIVEYYNYYHILHPDLKMPSLVVSVFSSSSVNREWTLVNYGHGCNAWFSSINYLLPSSPWHLMGISIF